MYANFSPEGAFTLPLDSHTVEKINEHLPLEALCDVQCMVTILLDEAFPMRLDTHTAEGLMKS